MSLDFDVSKIENYQELTTYTDENGRKFLHPVTSAIVYLTMAVGIGEITEKNWEDFYIRTNLWEKVFGPMVIRDDPYLTPEEIKAHIGLHTNVFPNKTDAQWRKNVFESFEREARYKLSKKKQ